MRFSTLQIQRTLLLSIFGTFLLIKGTALAQNIPVQGAPTPIPTTATQSTPLQVAEQQIPFDNDGNVWTITQVMEQQYGFLREYPNVMEARLYQTQTID